MDVLLVDGHWLLVVVPQLVLIPGQVSDTLF